MTENLKTESAQINKFILKAALNEVPIFDSYKNLCKIHPDKKMDYVDFEWKYYHFYNLDYNIERSPENSSPITFADLPMDVLEQVVEKLDIISRLALRNVSRDLRNLVDATKMHCRKVEFTFNGFSATICLDNFEFSYGQDVDGGCDVILSDVARFLKNPKLKIDEIIFIARKFGVWGKFSELLKSLNFKLNVKLVDIRTCQRRDVFPILHCLKPQCLEDIRISAGIWTADEFNQLSNMEQWKAATQLHWHEFSENVRKENFVSFEIVEIIPFKLNEENLMVVRDALLKSDQLKMCCIYNSTYRNNFGVGAESDKQKVNRIMSQNPEYDAKTRQFSVPNSRDYFQLEYIKKPQFDVLIIRKVSKF